MIVLDYFLTFVHLVIVGFNLLGWIWKSTRQAHFYLVIATVFCWTVLGIWFGFGYCPITDWQWSVKEQLGETNLPNSFIKYMVDKVTGMNVSSNLIDLLTAAGFGIVVIISCTLYVGRREL